MKILRGMAGEYEIPVWTASQANRSALEEDVIDASKVSESYGKSDGCRFYYFIV
jgi:hypothetical protein